MKPRSLPSFCVAVLLLTMAGCGYGPDNIRTGNKAPALRTRSQVSADAFAAMSDFEQTIRGIRTAADAKAAIPRISAYADRMKSLVPEGIAIEKTMTQEQLDQFREQDAERTKQAQASLTVALNGLGRVLNMPPEFVKNVLAVMQDIAKASVDAKNKPAPPPPEVLPSNPPDTSSWAVWVLCLLILGACFGFLSRDGLWNNALVLVNVVFAGLLAMNFYEWLANWMTNFSEDVHSYVSFFDFLALWACFVLFMAVFRAATDAVSRVRVRFLKIVDLYGGIVLSLCVGWVMVGFTLVSLHTAPLGQYPLLGCFQPQNRLFLGVLAPDREWLGFTRYQSWGPYCRSVGGKQFEQCIFPRDFIETQLERRMHIENYMVGNKEHKILVNKQMMAPPTVPGNVGGG